MDNRWEGNVAVITGGGTGIGLALAKALAREGMDIVIASRDAANLDAAAAEIRQSGRRVLAVPCDVADRAQVYALAGQAKAAFGHVDLVCANAGATTAGRLLDHVDEEWDWAIDINFRGVTHCVQAFYPDMAARRSGTIMITGSQTSLAPDWVLNHGPYVPAKAALLALATSLRAEAIQDGVEIVLFIPAGANTAIATTGGDVPPGADIRIGPRPDCPPTLPGYSNFLSAEEVAERALDGLRRRAPIIVTHAGMKPLVEDYFRRFLDAYDEAARFQPTAGRS